MKRLFICTLIALFTTPVLAQEEVLRALDVPKSERLGETILAMAQQFVGKPYVAGTLEKAPEKLVINFDEWDCFTLVENALALALTKHSPEGGADTFRQYLQLLRYRNGEINGYGSRLHYFVDWARQAEDNLLLMNITEKIGEPYTKSINFMSTQRRLYPALVKDETAFKAISDAEEALKEKPLFFIPKEKYTQAEEHIANGDIIAFTSTIKGLDVNHEGFAVRKDGKVYLLHASLDEKKVVITWETLKEYLFRIKKHSGIMIYRPVI